MKTTCEYCDIEVDMGVVAHSSGSLGIPACTAVEYSCGCWVKHTAEGKSIVTTHDGKSIELDRG